MIKLATITPINCITNKQDGEIFDVLWSSQDEKIIAVFENGNRETLEFTAKTLDDAADIVYHLYASTGYIYEQNEDI